MVFMTAATSAYVIVGILGYGVNSRTGDPSSSKQPRNARPSGSENWNDNPSEEDEDMIEAVCKAIVRTLLT